MMTMKKLLSVLLAVVMALFAVSALCEAETEPEGGMRFEGDWAMMGGLVEIVYEEEGYRVLVDLFDQEENAGAQWEYACFYDAETGCLASYSSRKTGYTLDPLTLDMTRGDSEYEGIDEENTVTVFSLTEDGALEWHDGHDDMGADLQFIPIGSFNGVWRNDDEDVYVEIHWQGLYDEETFFYSVFVHRGGDDQYADFDMAGLYDPETGMLKAAGTVVTTTLNASGTYDVTEDDEIYETSFVDLGDGTIMMEADNGIVLEYDILGPES